MTSAPNKSQLRKQYRVRREEVRRDEATAASRNIARALLAEPCMQNARSIAGYAALSGEIDPFPLLKQLHLAGKIIALPVADETAKRLTFRRWQPGDTLVPGAHNIPEPQGETVIPDVILMPLLCFDATGNRIGYGGGYYDRTLAAMRQPGSSTPPPLGGRSGGGQACGDGTNSILASIPATRGISCTPLLSSPLVGKGFEHRPLAIGIAYDFQQTSPLIISEPFDQPLDAVVTEAGMRWFI